MGQTGHAEFIRLINRNSTPTPFTYQNYWDGLGRTYPNN